MYGSSVFSVFLLSLREVRWACMMLGSDMLYMLVSYANPSGPMWLRCHMFTLYQTLWSFFFFFGLLPLGLGLVLWRVLFCLSAVCVGEVNVFSLKIIVYF